MKPLIQPTALAEMLNDNNTVIIDARSGADAKDRFSVGHLPGAKHVDLEKDLSQVPADASRGGRHPLPPIEQFTALLGTLGIDPETHVIVYDDKSGANAAARFWWMLKSLGHQKVQVVDGGLQAATRAGIALSIDTAPGKSTPSYPASSWLSSLVDINEVEKFALDKNYLVIDVREAYRYRGESEPIDLIAGHIPGAINVPYSTNLDVNGSFLPAEELATNYQQVIGDRQPQNVIVHCGSGVTACHTLLALEQAGINGAALYVGSWSEWSRTGREIAKG